MYIHIGGEKIVQASELIAIFDISIEKPSKISRQFMLNAQQAKSMENISDEDPKSIVITQDKIYYSPISSMTLKKRAQQLQTN